MRRWGLLLLTTLLLAGCLGLTGQEDDAARAPVQPGDSGTSDADLGAPGANVTAPQLVFQKNKAPDGRGAYFTVVSASNAAGVWGEYDLLADGTTDADACALDGRITASSEVQAGHRIHCTNAMKPAADGTLVELFHRPSKTTIRVGVV